MESMNQDKIIEIIKQYFSGHITRNELMLKARNIKPKVLCYAEYCSYKFVVLNDIVQVLSEIPELSYSDDELKDILEILENKRIIRNSYLFMIPEAVIGKKDLRLIKTVENFIENYKTSKIAGNSDCDNLKSYLSKEESEFLNQLNNELSKNEKENIVKTVETDIFAILNRFGGLWESVKSYFISVNDISADFLIETIKRKIEILQCKRPVFVCLSGKINGLTVSLF